jgi:hypothetical protein
MKDFLYHQKYIKKLQNDVNMHLLEELTKRVTSPILIIMKFRINNKLFKFKDNSLNRINLLRI